MEPVAFSEPAIEEQPTLFRYQFDEVRWPMVMIHSPRNVDPELVDYDTFYAEVDRLLADGRPFTVLHDLRGVRSMGPDRRRRFVEYANSHMASVKQLICGYAVLLDSQIMRGVVTAVLWFVRPPMPMKVFTNQADAEDWLATFEPRIRLESMQAS